MKHKKISVDHFKNRRKLFVKALVENNITAWIAFGNDRAFAGADHIRYFSNLDLTLNLYL